MVKGCCVRFCSSESYAGCNISFHRFPRNEFLRQKWLQSLYITCKITDNSCVCSRHFDKSSFYWKNSRNLLKANAVPSSSSMVVGPIQQPENEIDENENTCIGNDLSNNVKPHYSEESHLDDMPKNEVDFQKEVTCTHKVKVEPLLSPVLDWDEIPKTEIYSCKQDNTKGNNPNTKSTPAQYSSSLNNKQSHRVYKNTRKSRSNYVKVMKFTASDILMEAVSKIKEDHDYCNIADVADTVKIEPLDIVDSNSPEPDQPAEPEKPVSNRLKKTKVMLNRKNNRTTIYVKHPEK